MRNVALIPFAATAFFSRTLQKRKKKRKKVSSPPGEEIELQDWMVWRKDKNCKLSDASMDLVAETSVMDFVQINEKSKKTADDLVNFDSVVMETIPEEPGEAVKENQDDDFELLGLTSESELSITPMTDECKWSSNIQVSSEILNDSECSDDQNDVVEPQNDLSRISSPTAAPPAEKNQSPPSSPPLLSPNGSDSSIDIVVGCEAEEDDVSDNSCDEEERANMEERLRGGGSVTEDQLQNQHRKQKLAKIYEQVQKNRPHEKRPSKIPRKSKIRKSSTAEFLSDTMSAKNFMSTKGVWEFSEGFRIRVKKMNDKMEVISKDRLRSKSGDSPLTQNIVPLKLPRHPTFTRLNNVSQSDKYDNHSGKLALPPPLVKPTISIEDAITDLTITGKTKEKTPVHPKHQNRLNRGSSDTRWTGNTRCKLGTRHSKSLEKVSENSSSMNCCAGSANRWQSSVGTNPLVDSQSSQNLLRSRWRKDATDVQPQWLYKRQKTKPGSRSAFAKSSMSCHSSSATSSDEFETISSDAERPHYYRNLWMDSLSSYFIVELFTESGGAPWFGKHCGIRVGIGIIPLLVLLFCVFCAMYFVSDEILSQICPTYCPKLSRVTPSSYTPWNWFYG